MAYIRYTGDPYWKRARADGIDADGTPYAKGDRLFFYPRTGATYAGDAATRASAEFDELASLEADPSPSTTSQITGVLSWLSSPLSCRSFAFPRSISGA